MPTMKSPRLFLPLVPALALVGLTACDKKQAAEAQAKAGEAAEKVKATAESATEEAKAKAATVIDKASEAAGKVKANAESATEEAKAKAASLIDKAKEAAEKGREAAAKAADKAVEAAEKAKNRDWVADADRLTNSVTRAIDDTRKSLEAKADPKFIEAQQKRLSDLLKMMNEVEPNLPPERKAQFEAKRAEIVRKWNELTQEMKQSEAAARVLEAAEKLKGAVAPPPAQPAPAGTPAGQ